MEETKKVGNGLILYLLVLNILVAVFDTSASNISTILISIITVPLAFYVSMKYFKNIKNVKNEKIDFKNLIINSFIIIGIGCLGSYLYSFINYILSFTGYYIDDSVLSVLNPKTISDFLIIGLYTVIIAPIVEELLYRGLIIETLRKYKLSVAIVFSSVLFGLMHANFKQMVPAIFAGAFFAIVYLKTNSMKTIILMHAINNFLGLIFSYFNVNLDFIFSILAIVLFIYQYKKGYFKLDLKKGEKYKFKYLYSSISLIIFISICLLLCFLQVKSI